jgi:hypothetical protein
MPRTPIGLAWALSVTAGVLAQTSSPQTPQFRAGVDIVHLDVSVYDKAGNPVRGLTAADFTLLEDDKPRPIVAFSAVDIPPAPPPTAAWMRDAPIDVATNDIKDRRLFLIVIDDANYASFNAPAEIGSPSIGPRRDRNSPPPASALTMIESLKSAARTFIAHLAPTDLAAVVFTGDNRRSQDFTTDRARLIAAVNQTSAPGMDCRLSATYSVEVLRRATDLIIGAPGPRKALVTFTDFDQNMAVVPDSQDVCSHNYVVGQSLVLFESAQRAGVNVYTLKQKYDLPGQSAGWEDRWIRRIPHETGGEAFSDVRDPAVADAAAARIMQANSVYYVLGYSSAAYEKFHFIKVKVDRPDVEVRTRDKYYWPEKEKAKAGPEPPKLDLDISGLLPKSDLPMRATAVPLASADRKSAIVAIVASVRNPPVEGATPSGDPISLRFNLFTAEGKAVMSHATTARLMPRAGGGVDTDVLANVNVQKHGVYELRVAAESATRQAGGSVYLTVDVPDFTKDVALSGVVIAAPRGPAPAWTPDTPRALLPVVPTSRREFAKGEPLTAFVRVYQGGSSNDALATVPVHERLVDDHDRVIVDRVEPVVAGRFSATRSADVLWTLPVARLEAGEYFLSLEASIGKTTATRALRFSVK